LTLILLHGTDKLSLGRLKPPLNVKKSAGYDIKPRVNRSYVINDFHPKWEVVGQKLPLISPADNTKYEMASSSGSMAMLKSSGDSGSPCFTPLVIWIFDLSLT
jgi:hypothetical protein